MPNKRSRPSSDADGGRKKRPHTKEKEVKASAAQDEDPLFDQWLRYELAELYAPVLKEPIPDELMDIIKKHR